MLDVELPEMNGFDVCGALRAHPRTFALPVILVTGQTAVSDALSPISGDAGTGTQTFNDALSRLTGSTGFTDTPSYQYDLDGNHPEDRKWSCPAFVDR